MSTLELLEHLNDVLNLGSLGVIYPSTNNAYAETFEPLPPGL